MALVSGAQLAVSGSAAGLTAVVAASILASGDYRVFLLSVMIAGGFQLLLGILKLGSIAGYFPSSVIKGMMAAIGLILIAKQLPLALGYDRPDFWSGAFGSLFTHRQFFNNLLNLNTHFTRGAIIISLISLGLLIGLMRPFAKKSRWLPASLLVVAAGVVLNLLFTKMAPALTLKQTQLVSIPLDIFAQIRFPDFSKLFTSVTIWKDGLVIGLLATLETLLCLEAVDKLDIHNRITPVNRELVAQGIGNITCGLLGAIPITAVVVRGAANASAGGKTKLSAFTHGLFLLLAVALAPVLLNQIPYASLAAILLVTGYNLTKPRLYREMWRLGRKQFIPFVVTILVILVTDLLIGVTIGLLISVYYIILNNFKAEYKIVKSKQHETEVFLIKLNTNVTFLNKVNLKRALDRIPEYSILTIDGAECNFIDYDILEIISEFQNKAHDRHIEVHLPGIRKVNITALH